MRPHKYLVLTKFSNIRKYCLKYCLNRIYFPIKLLKILAKLINIVIYMPEQIVSFFSRNKTTWRSVFYTSNRILYIEKIEWFCVKDKSK